jgi:hypothetical protein
MGRVEAVSLVSTAALLPKNLFSHCICSRRTNLLSSDESGDSKHGTMDQA